MSASAIGSDYLAFGLAILLYGMATFNCLRIVGQRQSPAATFAWIFVNLGIPVLGVPLYYLLGRNRMTGYLKKHRRRTQAFHDMQATQLQMLGTAEKISSRISPEADEFSRVFGRIDPMLTAMRGRVGLLIDGLNTFPAIFDAIKNAQSYILVQYYILQSDRLGIELKDLLIDKAKQGIPIYLLYDDMGSFWLSSNYIRDLQEAGVRIARFLPVTKISRFFQLNFRNHRKLVVVDGIYAFTGGLNVGEEYATRKYQTKKRRTAYWRDTHVVVEGSGTIAVLEDVFLEDWYFATESIIELPKVNIEAHVGSNFVSNIARQEADIQVIPSGPADDQLISVLTLMQLFNSAKSRLWVATPYFVPDGPMMLALELAALRGVDVRLLIPRRGDHRFVQWATISYAEEIQAKGVRVYLYQRGVMHQKAILVDDHLAALGTMNIDNRAIYLNFETILICHSKELNAAAAEMLLDDFQDCKLLGEARKNTVLHRLKRLRGNTVRLVAPLM